MPIKNLVYEAPDTWFKPWADTVAYYPLTSDSTVNDMSWNWYTLSVRNSTPTFWTWQGVDCVYFNGSNDWLYNASVTSDVFWDNATFSFWLYSDWGWYRVPFASEQWTSSSALYWLWLFTVYDPTYTVRNWRWNSYADVASSVPVSSSQRYHILITREGGTKFSVYVNNELKGTNNIGSRWNWAILYLWHYMERNSFVARYKWWMSDFIIEKKVWAEEERTNYFNQVKAKYWL